MTPQFDFLIIPQHCQKLIFKCLLQLIFKEMSKISERKNSPQFLQKFKDKKQAIDREGLLKILDLKRKQIGNQRCIEENSHSKIKASPQSVIKIKKQKAQSQKQKTDNQRKVQKVSDLNKYQIYLRNSNFQQEGVKKKSRYQDERAQKQGQKSEDFSRGLKLPSIQRSANGGYTLQKNKSQMVISKQIAANSRLKSHQIETQVSEVSNSLSQKFQLDKYALKHLQLLNRFQRLLIDTRLSSGEKAVLNVKTQ